MSVSVKLRSSWAEINREVTRLNTVEVRAKRNLDRVLTAGFKLTQGAIHVKSGSLKTSGKKQSIWWDNSWHGEISYGGVSLGVNNPVTYAIYEKARDGDHDFFVPLKTLDSLYVEAILKSI